MRYFKILDTSPERDDSSFIEEMEYMIRPDFIICSPAVRESYIQTLTRWSVSLEEVEEIPYPTDEEDFIIPYLTPDGEEVDIDVRTIVRSTAIRSGTSTRYHLNELTIPQNIQQGEQMETRYFKINPDLIADGNIFTGRTNFNSSIMNHVLHRDFIVIESSRIGTSKVQDLAGWVFRVEDLIAIDPATLGDSDFHLTYGLSTGGSTTVDLRSATKTTMTSISTGRDYRVSQFILSEVEEEAYYYRFIDRYRLTGTPPTFFNPHGHMAYMLHPGFVIKRQRSLSSQRGTFTLHGWDIRPDALEPVPEDELTSTFATYRDQGTTSQVTIDVTAAANGTTSNAKIDGYELSNLIPVPIREGNYYYAISEDILKGSDNFTYGSSLAMGYMKHPDFRIVLNRTLTENEDFDYQTWSLSSNDVVLKTPSAGLCNYTKGGRTVTYDIHEKDKVSGDTIRDIATDERFHTSDLVPITIDRPVIPGAAARQRPTRRKPPVSWGPTQEYTVSFYENYLKDQIRTRYAFFERPRDGKKNIIVDSLFPRLMYNYGFYKDTPISSMRNDIPKTAIAISPFCASILGVQKMEIEQLCLVLGYTKKDIAKLCRAVKKKNKDFVFVGAGGTNINTAHWLTEMCKMSNVQGIFKSVRVFEEDTAELSNLLRFPKDPTTVNCTANTGIHKSNIIADDVEYLGRSCEFHRSYIPDSRGRYPSSVYRPTITRDPQTGAREQTEVTLRHPESTILYGAPTIETRDAMSKHGNFICATHADSSCSMWLNPIQGTDLNIQIESYGMIQLGTFFVNQLKMAITLLELLTSEDLNLSEQDQELLDYSFDGASIGATDRVYNWQTLESPTMMTEAEAATF